MDEQQEKLNVQNLERIRNERIALATNYLHTFSSETGRMVLESLEKEFGFYAFYGKNVKDKNGRFDTDALVFNSGAKFVLDHINHMIEFAENPKKFLD